MDLAPPRNAQQLKRARTDISNSLHNVAVGFLQAAINSRGFLPQRRDLLHIGSFEHATAACTTID